MRVIVTLAGVVLFAAGFGGAFAAAPGKRPPPRTVTQTRTVVSTAVVRKRSAGGSSSSSGSTIVEVRTATATVTDTVTVRAPAPLHGIARFRERETSHTTGGEFAGAVETWHVRVLLARRQTVVGLGHVVCWTVNPGTAMRLCVAAYDLPRGSIALAGTITRRSRFELVIVGGTGVYANAGGTGLFVETATVPRQALDTFYLAG